MSLLLQEPFSPKKRQRLGQRSRLPASHGAARRDRLAKSPSWAPELPVREAGELTQGWVILGLNTWKLPPKPLRVPWGPVDVGEGWAGGAMGTP